MSNPFTTAIATEPAATDGQIGFIRNLLDHRDIFSLFDSAPKTAERVEVIRAAIVATPTPTVTGEWGDEVNRHLAKPLTKAGASKLIDLLQTMPEHNRPTMPRGNAHYAPVEDGFYTLIDPETNGDTDRVIKVQTSPNSGRQYAKELDVNTSEWNYRPGLIKFVRDEGVALTLDKAKELGQLYGVCVRCGRTLTDENSIAAGIGPICAGKF